MERIRTRKNRDYYENEIMPTATVQARSTDSSSPIENEMTRFGYTVIELASAAATFWNYIPRFIRDHYIETQRQITPPSSSATCIPHEQHFANSVIEVIQSECQSGKEVGYPAYGITTSETLTTKNQLECAVLTIYDPKSHRTLLAHMLTQFDEHTTLGLNPIPNGHFCMILPEEERPLHLSYSVATPTPYCHTWKYPLNWYVAAFQHSHFDDLQESPLQITIVSSWMTPYAAANQLIESTKQYFPNATINHLCAAHSRIQTTIDSQNGAVTIIGEEYLDFDGGYEEPGPVLIRNCSK